MDEPYSGGAITRLYHKPEDNVNCIQIEVRRGLYMKEIHDPKSDDRFEINPEKAQKLNKILFEAIKDTSEFAKEFYMSD